MSRKLAGIRWFFRRAWPFGLASFVVASASGLCVLPILHRLRQVLGRVDGDAQTNADAILVLGQALDGDALTRGFEARLAHAESLFRAGLAPSILVSGGVTGTATRSEAAAGVEWLASRGVPMAALLAEEESVSTVENLANVRLFMRVHGFARLILVSHPLHLGRAVAMARHFDVLVSCSPAVADAPTRGSFAWYGHALREAFYVHW